MRDRSAQGSSAKIVSTLHGLAWVSPWIVGFVLFMLAPMGVSLYYSLTDYSLLEPPISVGLANYRELANDHVFWVTVRNTGLYALFSVVLGTILTIGLAAVLNSNRRGVGLVRAVVFLPTLVPLVAAALAWTWMYNGEAGLINSLLGRIGIDGPNWLGDRRWAMSALVMMSLWQVGGAVVICLIAMRDVPQSLYQAVSIDGAGPIRRFWHVTLPMISPAILFNVIMAIIWSLQVFAVPYIMTKGGPEDATRFYTQYLYENAFVYGRMGYASAMAWIQLLAVLVLTGITIRLSRRFVHYRIA